VDEQETDVPEDSFGEHLVENLFASWIDSDLVRRGTAQTRADVYKAVIELPPSGSGAVVRINEEVSLIARAIASAPVQKGELVTSDNASGIESFWPEDVHPDSGWLAFMVLGGAAYVAFDLRYNKQRTAELLGLAEEYLDVAKSTYLSALRPAIDNLLSAAELTVQAQMLAESSETKFHNVRDKWLRQDEQLGNAPEGFFDLLAQLRRERAAARYGDGPLSIRPEDFPALTSRVHDMIAHAAARVGVVRASEMGTDEK